MSDHDPPPWQRRPRIQTSEDRDLAARRARSHPFGLPIVPPHEVSIVPERDFDEVTSPFDLLEREPGPEVQSVVERSPRSGSDPATFADVVKLAVALTSERSGNRQRERVADQVLRTPHDAARSSRRLLVATVAAAATSIAGAVVKWSDHAAAAGTSGDAVRDQLQHEIDRLDAELRDLRLELGRRSERSRLVPTGSLPDLTVTTKGHIQ